MAMTMSTDEAWREFQEAAQEVAAIPHAPSDSKNYLAFLEASLQIADIPFPTTGDLIVEQINNLRSGARQVIAVGAAAVTLASGGAIVAKIFSGDSSRDTAQVENTFSQATEEAQSRELSTTQPIDKPNKPVPKAELEKRLKSNFYTSALKNREVTAAVMQMATLPDGTTFRELAFMAKVIDPEIKFNDFAEALQLLNPGLIPTGSDAWAKPIATDQDQRSLVLAGWPADKIDILAKGIMYSRNAEAAQETAAATAEVAPNNYNIQYLAQSVLSHQNIAIASSDNDQVRQSIEVVAKTGKTFGHNISQQGNLNVDCAPRLFQMALYLANKGHKFTIESMTTGNHVEGSNHFVCEAFDLLPEGVEANQSNSYYSQSDIIAKFQPIYKDLHDAKDVFNIDEEIYSFPPDGTTGLRHGANFTFFGNTRANHFGHIHVSTSSRELVPGLEITISSDEAALINSFAIEPDKKMFLIESIIAARKVAILTGVNPADAVAQAIIESNWGRSAPGNNYHGMKVDGLWKGARQQLNTFEYNKSGQRYNTKAWFKAYGSMEESFMDHAALLARAPHYRDAMAASSNWRTFLHGLVNPGEPAYATAPNYEKVVSDIIENFQLAALCHTG